MRDLFNNLAVVQAIAPAVQTGDVSSSAIDLLGFDSALIVVNTGAIAGAGDFDIQLSECDTSDGDFTAVDASNILGTLATGIAASSAFKAGYVGARRFIKVTLKHQGGTSVAADAVVVKGHPHLRPV